MYRKRSLTILIPKAFLTGGVPTKEYPIRLKLFPMDEQSCTFSSSNLFCQKSFFAWNYYFLQILIHIEKTKETIVWYFIDIQYLLQTTSGILNSLICTAQKKWGNFFCFCSIACKKSRTDWIIKIFSFNNKDPLYSSLILTLQLFEGQNRQAVT